MPFLIPSPESLMPAHQCSHSVPAASAAAAAKKTPISAAVEQTVTILRCILLALSRFDRHLIDAATGPTSGENFLHTLSHIKARQAGLKLRF